MNIWLELFLFAVGVALIVKGGDWFVDAASWMARVSGIPSFIIGATVVSLATTLPELFVSALAAAEGKVDMAIGNAVGSITANTALILSISILFMTGILTPRKSFLPKVVLLAASVAFMLVGCLGGELKIWAAVLLLVAFGLFIWENVSSARKDLGAEQKEERVRPGGKEIAKNVVLFILGAAGIVVGSRLLVDSGSAIAEYFGVPERIIAVTLVAIGTSLPELVTTVTSVVKKQTSLSVGNILGANILDLTMIMPVCSLISGKALPVAEAAVRLDIPVCLAAVLIAFVPAMFAQRFRRWQGAALLALYAGYLVYTFA